VRLTNESCILASIVYARAVQGDLVFVARRCQLIKGAKFRSGAPGRTSIAAPPQEGNGSKSPPHWGF
jgi:hypothetical protein